MRKALLFIVPLILLVTTACSITITPPGLHKEVGSGNLVTQQRDVSGFDQVKLAGVGILTITQGNQESLTVEADDNIIDHIQTDVINGQLSIKLEPNFNFTSPNEIHYTLSVKDLSRLELSGFGDVYLDQLTTNSFEVKLSGSGNLNLGELQSDRLDVTISGFGNVDLDQLTTGNMTVLITGSGNFTLNNGVANSLKTTISGFGSADVSGQVTDLGIEIKGSGNFKGGDLHAQTTDVYVSGMGDATIWTDQTLTVNISGSGSVNYYGEPQVNQKVSGLGSLNSLGSK